MKGALDKVVLYQVNAGDEDGAELYKSFKLRGAPAFVLTNGAEKTYAKWTGYKKGGFIKSLSDAMPSSD